MSEDWDDGQRGSGEEAICLACCSTRAASPRPRPACTGGVARVRAKRFGNIAITARRMARASWIGGVPPGANGSTCVSANAKRRRRAGSGSMPIPA